MTIGLIGYGRMGKEVERLALERGWKVGFHGTTGSGPLREKDAAGVDVGIHFATGSSVAEHVEQWSKFRKPLVIGTTGWDDALNQVRRTVEGSGIGLLYGANFSPGIHLFTRLAALAGSLADRSPEYDVAIHEAHHRGKPDSPSGTALMLGRILLDRVRRKSGLLTGPPEGRIDPKHLQISSARVGSVVGTHSVILDSPADTIQLVHTARNRTGFALGALLGAEWILNRKGLHTVEELMTDLFGQ